MTKREAKQARAEWNLAIAEGRAIRYQDGLTFKSYPTVDAAIAEMNVAKAAGIKAEIVS